MCVGEERGDGWKVSVWIKPQPELTSTRIVIVDLVALNVLVDRLLSFLCMPFLPSLSSFSFNLAFFPVFLFLFPLSCVEAVVSHVILAEEHKCCKYDRADKAAEPPFSARGLSGSRVVVVFAGAVYSFKQTSCIFPTVSIHQPTQDFISLSFLRSSRIFFLTV